ncbi:AbrB/MazE/SpoVT family DNA-binding domain-containing protein [Candidatus Enterococcus ikei]|uniref:AbrB/MazE/SpoVT family DNA-binding domain-containing protein n=1 Tax=Candidatus Enterococcus ikei TaxID=2815326 RepID=A0ABS3GZV8_9ENTE|nr:AbrB/MazE/SpoVT family DNA-binding domain-containing protein [Enterococcus sp. DIV0869a]
MEDKQFRIALPNKIVEEFQLENEDEVTVSIKDQKIVIEPKKKVAGNQTMSLRWFLIPTTVVSILFLSYLMFNNYTQVALTGRYSIADFVLVLGISSGVFSFLLFFIRGKRNQVTTLSKDIYWRNFPAILLSFIVILLFSILVFFKVIDLVFSGASFDLYTATLLFFVFVGAINYFMIYSALSITPSKLTNLLIFVIFGGVLLSMITNRDHQWWQFNFSFLGTIEAKSSWQFNVTLMFSALLMVALIDSLFVELQKAIPHSRRLTILKILLTLTALDLGAVGLFPYTETGPFQGVHNQVAGYLVYLIVILIVGIKWLLPNVTKEFLSISYMIAATLVVVVVLFQWTSYLSLTAFELLSFMLAFSWIVLLLQNLQKMAQNLNNSFQVIVEQSIDEQ